MELARPESVADAVAALGNGAVALARRHRARAAAQLAHRPRGHARRAAQGGAEGDRRHDDRRRHDARRARGRPGDPGGAARGVPPLRVAAAARDRNDRRQPAAGDALLVLAPQVPVPPARRRPLPRARGRASRARDLRERLLRVGASVRSRGRAARARRDDPHRPARAADRRPLPAADRGRPCHDDPGKRRADPRARGSEARRVRLPEGDGPAALVVRARRRRGRALRRRRAPRPRGRRADPVERSLDGATPLPGTAYKTTILDALVRRARAAVASAR